MYKLNQFACVPVGKFPSFITVQYTVSYIKLRLNFGQYQITLVPASVSDTRVRARCAGNVIRGWDLKKKYIYQDCDKLSIIPRLVCADL